MKTSLSKSEMLELWRNLRAAEPIRLDCTVGRTDGVDYDEFLEREMRAWYLDLLDNGNESQLATVDVAAQAQTVVGNGLTVVEAPSDCRRILRVQFSDWTAAIAPNDELTTVEACAGNPFSLRPKAARINNRTIAVCGTVGELSSLVCAVDHGTQSYIFDDSAIKTIIDYDENRH